MGYILVIVIGVALLVLLAVGLAGSSDNPQGKRGFLRSKKPPVRDQPAAEEANPAASSTASERQVEEAQRRTPPA